MDFRLGCELAPLRPSSWLGERNEIVFADTLQHEKHRGGVTRIGDEVRPFGQRIRSAYWSAPACLLHRIDLWCTEPHGVSAFRFNLFPNPASRKPAPGLKRVIRRAQMTRSTVGLARDLLAAADGGGPPPGSHNSPRPSRGR